MVYSQSLGKPFMPFFKDDSFEPSYKKWWGVQWSFFNRLSTQEHRTEWFLRGWVLWFGRRWWKLVDRDNWILWVILERLSKITFFDTIFWTKLFNNAIQNKCQYRNEIQSFATNYKIDFIENISRLISSFNFNFWQFNVTLKVTKSNGKIDNGAANVLSLFLTKKMILKNTDAISDWIATRVVRNSRNKKTGKSKQARSQLIDLTA